jgi:hypothetical protein
LRQRDALPWVRSDYVGLEANVVIGLRSIKVARGGVDAVQEINLMVQEKVDAAVKLWPRWSGAAALRLS